MRILLLLASSLAVRAAASAAEAPAKEPWNSLHFQATAIEQGNDRFAARFTGPNSFQPYPQRALSLTSTVFLGVRLRPGTEVYVNPELTGGHGLSDVFGMGGAPNGETYRVGNPQPTVSAARLFVRQVFGFGSETEKVDDGQNQIAGAQAARRLTVVAGKFSVPDYFDGNSYSHDPRTQFMNWALMSQAAWDFPADTRGYTWGLMAEYHDPSWAIRSAVVAEPKVANMLDMDRRIGRANGSVIELEHDHSAGGRNGAVRLDAFFNQARMGSYDQALVQARKIGTAPDVVATEAYGRTKYGFALGAEQALCDALGAFARFGWSDGRSETWAFTEVDESESFGVEWKPSSLGRPEDRLGAAAAFNELSIPHRRYLAAGGQGFELGDRGLHYGPEVVAELYYRIQVKEWLWVSPDGQFVINPGYDRARGPVPIWSVRLHVQL